jgi:hypothetical protein
VLGQTGSNGRGQTGSNGRGQTGSNGRAISIDDVLGQTGSNGRGQTGSNGRGQTGSNGRTVTSAAMGVVERVGGSGQSNTVVVLGQEYTLDAVTVGVGDYVLITLDQTETTLQKISQPYVAGVSPVLLVGLVSGVDSQTANLTVGGVSVDYTSQLTLDPGLSPTAGAIYATVGIQPSPGGAILAGLQYDGATVSLSSP